MKKSLQDLTDVPKSSHIETVSITNQSLKANKSNYLEQLVLQYL